MSKVRGSDVKLVHPADFAVDSLPPTQGVPVDRLDTGGRPDFHEQVPLAVHETHLVAQRELLSVLRLVDGAKLAVGGAVRRPTPAAIASVGAILEGLDFYPSSGDPREAYTGVPGPIRAFAWPMLLQAGRLAEIAGARLRLTAEGRKALFDPPSATVAKLWGNWRDTELLDELSRIDCVKGQKGRGAAGLTAVSERREIIVEALGDCPAGRWVPFRAFSQYIAGTSRLIVTGDPWSLYIGSGYGYSGVGRHSALLEERYIMAFMLEYAATLGLVDVALIHPSDARLDFQDMWGTDHLDFLSRYDGLIYFRINPLGAYSLGMASTYEPPGAGAGTVLRVLPNLEIVAAGVLAQSDRLALDSYATRVSDHLWRLESAQLLSAIAAGRQIAEIREFLVVKSGAPIPGTVARLLDDTEQRAVKVVDRGLVRLVECADAMLAALIANDRRTRKYCMPAGDRHLAVPGGTEAAFRRGLKAMGYLVHSAGIGPAAES